jgi:hypothetical protein
MVVGSSSRQDIVIDDEVERASRQYVSGNVFSAFGLRPALGRLIVPSDDVEPRGRDVAVLSYEYWSRRFGRDPEVVGRTFRWGEARSRSSACLRRASPGPSRDASRTSSCPPR